MLAACAAAGCGARTDLADIADDCPTGWVRRFDEGRDDAVLDLRVDDRGDVYVSGWSFTGPAPNDFAFWLRKLDAEGTELWVNWFDATDIRAMATWVAPVPSGGVLFAMPMKVQSEPTRLEVKALDADGLELWSRSYGEYDSHASIDAAADGSFVLATTLGDDSEKRGTIRRCDADGNTLWQGVPHPQSTSTVTSVAVDSPGNVFATGTAAGADDSTADMWLARFDPAANEVWTVRASAAERANRLVLADDGTLRIAGASAMPSGSGAAAWLRKYDANGTLVWSVDLDSKVDAWAYGSALAVGRDAHVNVVGSSGDDTDRDGYLSEHDADGHAVWREELEGPSWMSPYRVGVTDGDMIVGGQFRPGAEGALDAWVERYCR
jgi:hypothetical protein